MKVNTKCGVKTWKNTYGYIIKGIVFLAFTLGSSVKNAFWFGYNPLPKEKINRFNFRKIL